MNCNGVIPNEMSMSVCVGEGMGVVPETDSVQATS